MRLKNPLHRIPKWIIIVLWRVGCPFAQLRIVEEFPDWVLSWLVTDKQVVERCVQLLEQDRSNKLRAAEWWILPSRVNLIFENKAIDNALYLSRIAACSFGKNSGDLRVDKLGRVRSLSISVNQPLDLDLVRRRHVVDDLHDLFQIRTSFILFSSCQCRDPTSEY